MNENISGIAIHIIGKHCSGKKVLCEELIKNIKNRKITYIDEKNKIELAKGLSYTKENRSLLIKRIGYICSEIVKHGGIALFYSSHPYIKDRKFIRNLISTCGNYIEIYLDTDISICKKRDKLGLYNLAEFGKLENFTGVDTDFEGVELCEIRLNGSDEISDNIKIILEKIKI